MRACLTPVSASAGAGPPPRPPAALVDGGHDQARAEDAVPAANTPGGGHQAVVGEEAGAGVELEAEVRDERLCSVCTKPMAKITRPAGSSKAEPGVP